MTSPRLKAFIILLFALSGISGLIYEICWSKYLALFMGSTAYSHMIVLATFMGGLALGAWRLGKAADRSANPLRLYGMLEIVIALFCAAYPLLIGFCEQAFIALARSLHIASDGFALTTSKCLVAALTLLVPTFCMGGTLPVLLKPFTRTIQEAGREVARLYWVNSAGAVVGAALAGFFLIRLYTLDGAVWCASAVNGAVGIAALLLSRTLPRAPEQPAARPGAMREPFADIAIAVALLSGLIAMIYELAWIRLLTTLLGSSTYSFTVMLMAFISGIALGSWIIARVIERPKNLLRLLAACQVGTAVFMLATLPFYERLPYWLWKLSALLKNTPGNFPLFLFCEFAFCFLLMIIPTTLSGMSLPVASRLVAGDLRLLGRRVGNVFSVNTIGAVAGALLTGLLLIPSLGVKPSIEVALGLNALLGLAILARDRLTPKRWTLAAAAALLLLGAVYRLAVPNWNENVSAAGVYRAFFETPPESFAAFVSGIGERKMLWYREGLTANVAVTESILDDGTPERSLIINGKADASTVNDLPTQILLAQIPLTIAPDTGAVLVIGLGSGITAGSALRHPIRSLDCVEISPEVVEGNREFTEYNHHALDDPRTRLHIEDAITFIKINPQRYSCIISEPSNPWIAGIGNLFTTEFFELSKERLERGGILAQWFHTYDVNDEIFQLVLRTLTRSFPYVMLWMPTDVDVILTASMEPINPPFGVMEQRISRTAVSEELSRIKLFDLPALLSTQLAGPATTAFIAGEGPVNSEKRPLLELLAPVSFFTHARVAFTNVVDRRFDADDTTLLLSGHRSRLEFQNLLNIARFQSNVAVDDYRLTYVAVQECLKLRPEDVESLTILAGVTKAMNSTVERLGALERLIRLRPDAPQLILTYATEFSAWRSSRAPGAEHAPLDEPIRLLLRGVKLTEAKDERYFIRLAELLAADGRPAEAAAGYAAALALRDTYEPMEESLGDDDLASLAARNYLDAHDRTASERLLERLKTLNPQHAELPSLAQKLAAEKKGS